MAEFDIGFLGGGQLARMSIQAAQRMGLRCLSLDSAELTPASQLAAAIVGQLDDPECVAEIFRRCERVTLENEFIPADAIRTALQISGVPEERLTPGVETLALIQDKLLQRQALSRAGVPSPKALPLESESNPTFPVVLKARFGGYDGKGTRYARDREEFESHRPLYQGGGWLYEDFVDFRRELAVMVYRSRSETGVFATMTTVQSNHVCDLVFPSDTDASEIAIAAVEAVSGYGLFGVELFELESGAFLVNELAPRPHNTGHYTLDWGGISQFDQHVRLTYGVACAAPVGMPTCMANLLGQPGAGDFRQALRATLEAVPEARVHWYGKADSRPGRKMGHINVVGNNAVSRAKLARETFYRAWTAT